MKQHIFLIIVIAFLLGCSKTENKNTSSALNDLNIFIGQAYPSKHLVLLKVNSGLANKTEWPKVISFAPLVPTSKNLLVNFKNGFYSNKRSNLYVPEFEKMPAIHTSKCTPSTYKSNAQFKYSENKILVDFFDRGYSDNCIQESNVTIYKSNQIIQQSIPIIGFANNSDKFEISYNNFGKPLLLDSHRKNQVNKYKKDFRVAYKKAYGTNYNENESNIGQIPTIADAIILAEVSNKATQFIIRISIWERISIAQHIYRVMVFDFMKKEKLIESHEISKAQGYLG